MPRKGEIRGPQVSDSSLWEKNFLAQFRDGEDNAYLFPHDNDPLCDIMSVKEKPRSGELRLGLLLHFLLFLDGRPAREYNYFTAGVGDLFGAKKEKKK